MTMLCLQVFDLVRSDVDGKDSPSGSVMVAVLIGKDLLSGPVVIAMSMVKISH